MAFVEQRIGAREQEQGGVPEAHQVGHEGLFVGIEETQDDDLEFGDHDQQRQPGEADRPGEQRDRYGDRHQGQVHDLRAEGRLAEILRQALADDVDEQPFDPKEGNDRIGETDQKHAPEGGPGDERADSAQPLRVRIERALPRPQNVGDDRNDGDRIERDLKEGEGGAVAGRLLGRRETEQAGIAKQGDDAGPFEPEHQIGVRQIDEAEIGNGERQDAQRRLHPAGRRRCHRQIRQGAGTGRRRSAHAGLMLVHSTGWAVRPAPA